VATGQWPRGPDSQKADDRRESVTPGSDESPARTAIVNAMRVEGHPVSARRLAGLTKMERRTVQYHLVVLRDEDLVEIAHVDYRGSHVEHYYRLRGTER
jgi:DNA-binding transcriptional ArsR family regulator